MDKLLLQDIEIWTRIGVTPEERSKPQNLRVSVEIFTNLKTVADKDDPKAGIDYDRVISEVQNCATLERRTIERLAEDIAEAVLKEFSPESVAVTVKKRPHPDLDFVSVTIHRDRK